MKVLDPQVLLILIQNPRSEMFGSQIYFKKYFTMMKNPYDVIKCQNFVL